MLVSYPLLQLIANRVINLQSLRATRDRPRLFTERGAFLCGLWNGEGPRRFGNFRGLGANTGLRLGV